MAIDHNNALANELLDFFATKYPAGSTLELRTGPPAGSENAAGGTLLVPITLPATPWGTAAGGALAKSGTWSGNAVAGGNIGHYRLKNAAGTRITEGLVTLTGGGGDATVDSIAVVNGQGVSCTAFGFSQL